MLCLCICVRGAGAVRVARDELVAFVVHRVAQRARDRHQEANERDAEDEDAAPATVCVIGHPKGGGRVATLIHYWRSKRLHRGTFGKSRFRLGPSSVSSSVSSVCSSEAAVSVVLSSVEFVVGAGVDVSSAGR